MNERGSVHRQNRQRAGSSRATNSSSRCAHAFRTLRIRHCLMILWIMSVLSRTIRERRHRMGDHTKDGTDDGMFHDAFTVGGGDDRVRPRAQADCQTTGTCKNCSGELHCAGPECLEERDQLGRSHRPASRAHEPAAIGECHLDWNPQSASGEAFGTPVAPRRPKAQSHLKQLIRGRTPTGRWGPSYLWTGYQQRRTTDPSHDGAGHTSHQQFVETS